MSNIVNKFRTAVQNSLDENEKEIKKLVENKLYRNAMGTLREEIELYIKLIYFYYQEESKKKELMNIFFEKNGWRNVIVNKFADIDFIDTKMNNTELEWERTSYKFADSFVHFSVLYNYLGEDVTEIVELENLEIIDDYINQYFGADLNIDSSIGDILQYAHMIYGRIKENMEFYLEGLNM
jgi:hypothetical protein